MPTVATSTRLVRRVSPRTRTPCLPWVVFRAAAPPGLAGLIRPAPVESGSLLPWEARARRHWGQGASGPRGAKVLPGPGSWCRPDPFFLADPSNLLFAVIVLVNLELMDVVGKTKQPKERMREECGE